MRIQGRRLFAFSFLFGWRFIPAAMVDIPENVLMPASLIIYIGWYVVTLTFSPKENEDGRTDEG